MTVGSTAPGVVVLEPSLVDMRGHHFRALEELIQALAPIRPVVIANLKLDRSLLPSDLQVHRLFTRTVSDSTSIGPRPDGRLHRRIWKLRKIANRILQRPGDRRGSSSNSHRQWSELARVISEDVCRDAHHFILPTATPDLILELEDLLKNTGTSRLPRLHARVISADRPSGKEVDKLFMHAAAQSRDKRSLYLYVEMPAMQRHFFERYGVQTDLFPYLLNEPARTGACQTHQESYQTFVYLGGPRTEKGFHRLAPILGALAADPAFDRKRCQFIVHIGSLGRHAERLGRELKRQTGTFGIDLEIRKGALSAEDYAALLERADCLLLPHASDRYRLSGSGLLFEALLNAIPFICSSGLSFSDYARNGNAIEAKDDVEFARAILAFAENPAPFYDGARQSAEAFRASLRSNALLARIRGAP